jgi:acetyl-CoA synthetase
LPYYGVDPAIMDEEGQKIEGPGEGYLVLKRPWPGMLKGLHKNQGVFEETYFKKFRGYYYTGDSTYEVTLMTVNSWIMWSSRCQI